MKNDSRSKLPNRPDASERPVFPRWKVADGRLPPGPGRRFDRRHFARMESSGIVLMTIICVVAVYWFFVELGMWPDWFGWHSRP
jgi:hypothetical protein